MPDRFQDFCRVAEQAIAEVMANGHDSLIALARKHGAKWHPNGFVVFELGLLEPGSLRLHIWPAGPRQMRDTSAHVHTHVWDLYSRILVGIYQERMYDAVPDGGDGTHMFRTARIDYGRDRNSLMESAASHLRPAETVTAKAGEFHAVQAGQAHETLVPLNAFVATLLIVSPPRLDEALVYSERAFPAAEHTRAALSPDEQDALLGELRVGLANEPTR